MVCETHKETATVSPSLSVRLTRVKIRYTKVIEHNETMLKQTLMSIPAGRIGDPIDIANAAPYLVSNESDYVTGASIVVDGGWSVR